MASSTCSVWPLVTVKSASFNLNRPLVAVAGSMNVSCSSLLLRRDAASTTRTFVTRSGRFRTRVTVLPSQRLRWLRCWTTFTAACGWPTGALVPPPPPQAAASNVNAATAKALKVGWLEWTRAMG